MVDFLQWTVDMISRWDIEEAQEFFLCDSNAMEIVSHLYFECLYSNYIWHILLNWIWFNITIRPWKKELSWVNSVSYTRHRGIILDFLFATTIYQTWCERNNYKFQQ